MAAVAEVPDTSLQVNIEIVRPGTWSAVVEHLTKAGPGYFHLIHLDVHGLVIQNGERKGVYLNFLLKSGSGIHHKKAADVAAEFCKFGVHGVVLNACRSASTLVTGQHSLPAAFIESGISMVVAMSVDISMGAVEKFVAAFYTELFAKSRPFYAAISSARLLLATEPERSARFGLKVKVDDWIVPHLYIAEEITFCQKSYKQKFPVLSYSLQRALESVQPYVSSIKDRFRRPESQKQLLLGRDGEILELETLLLLPLRRPGLVSVPRKHLHLHGWAGVGKSAILHYLLWWWKATRMVEDSYYVDCTTVKPFSTQKLLKLIFSQVPSHVFLPGEGVRKLIQHLDSSRYLLILDHLDCISNLENGATEKMKMELTQFLATLQNSKSFVITASRNSSEDWLIVPRAQIYPVKLEGLSSPKALLLARQTLEEAGASAESFTNPEDLEYISLLLEQQEHLPVGIQRIARLLVESSLTPKELYVAFKKGESPITQFPNDCRFWEDIASYFGDLYILGSRRDEFGLSLLTLTMDLTSYKRRIPMELGAYFIYRIWRYSIGTPSDFRHFLDRDQLYDLRLATASELVQKDWVKQILDPVQEMMRPTFAILHRKHFIWPESFEVSSGLKLQYWHIHPLFSLALQHWATHVNAAADREGSPSLRESRTAFAHFYERRLAEFDDSETDLAVFSRQRMLFELDNITTAMYAWLAGDDYKIYPSMILLRITQSFNLNILERRDYREILNMLKHTVERYVAFQETLGEEQMGEIPLESFLQAASQIQNMYFSTSEWPLTYKYAHLICQMLKRNQQTMVKSLRIQLEGLQTDMVLAFEMFSRDRHHAAKKMFLANLAKDEPDGMTLTMKVGYAKLNFMNLLGLFKCDINDPEIHTRELDSLYEQLREATNTYVQLHRSLGSHLGWEKDNQMLLSSVLNMKKGIEFRKSILEAKDGEEIDVLGYLTHVFKITSQDYHGKQGSIKTMYSVFSKPESYQSSKATISALLDGLTLAYEDSVDDSSLSQYHAELVRAAISSDDWLVALENHQSWWDLRIQQSKVVDAHTQAYCDYIYGICYLYLGDDSRSRDFTTKSLMNCEKIGDDKVQLSCFHILSMLELRAGNFDHAVRNLCHAGMLAYRRENETRYDAPGRILKSLAYTVGVASGIVDAEDLFRQQSRTLGRRIEGEKSIIEQAHSKTGSMVSSEQPSLASRETSKQGALWRKAIELVKILRDAVGVSRVLRISMELLSDSHPFISIDGNFQWDRAEEVIFGEVQDSENLLQGPAIKSTTTLSISDPPAQRYDTNTDLVSQTLPLSITASDETVTAPTEDSVQLEVLLPLLMKFSGGIRDSRKRTVFWHLCGAGPLDMSSMPPTMAPNLQGMQDLDAESRFACVKLMLESGADGNVFDDSGITALMRAIETGDFDIANLLFDQRASINNCDFLDETALHKAATRQDLVAVNFCISLGCSLELKNTSGMTALALAVQMENIDICRVLINSGGNVLAKNNTGQSCLLLAAQARRYPNLALCICTLEQFGTGIVRRVLLDYGYTRQNFIDLFVANWEDFNDEAIDYFEQLFDLPEDLTVGDRAGVTPYHRSVIHSHPSIVENVFISSHADANVRDNTCFELTPVHCAAFNTAPHLMMGVLADKGSGDMQVKDRMTGLGPIALLMTRGFTMTSEEADINITIPSKPNFLENYVVAWAAASKHSYVSNLSNEALEDLRGIRRDRAFGLEGSDEVTNPFFAALMELSNQSPREKVNSLETLFTRNIEDDDSDQVIEFRFDLPWKWNPRRFPQVYHFDRKGTCRYVQPMVNRDDEVCRVWVVDELGSPKGVLGALDW